MTDLILYSKPFDWNDNLSEEAIEDFETIRGKLTYCQHQSIGMALAKLELLEKQGCKVIDPSGSSSENPNKCDDAISRKFEGIVVEYPPADLCIYPEYKGRPYFSIRYEENGEHIIGFGTYNPEVLTRYLQEYFISDIQPKTGHWIEDAGTYYKAIHERGCEPDENTPIFLDDIACSECLAKFSVIDNETERFECCPHCGAKMVEPQEGGDQE